MHIAPQLLAELGQQPNLERFRLEYETLYRALKKSHESEKRLVKKCRELTSDIGGTVQKTQSALKLSANDQNDIAALKNDILRMCAPTRKLTSAANAAAATGHPCRRPLTPAAHPTHSPHPRWPLTPPPAAAVVRSSTSVESSLIKEKETKEELGSLKEEIEGLRIEVKQGASGSVQQEAKLRDLTAMRDDLMRERDATAHQVMQTRNDSTELGERLKVVEHEKVALDAAVAELKREIDARKNETEREKRRKEREEGRLKELKTTLETRQGELKGKQTQVARGAELSSKVRKAAPPTFTRRCALNPRFSRWRRSFVCVYVWSCVVALV